MYFGEIEGTGLESLDAEFDQCSVGHSRVERLWTGARWCEGPVWFAAGRYLLFSDIPNNRIMRWNETNGSVSVFREPSNNSNGNAIDLQGRLISCEHLTRRVTRTEHNGDISVLANSHDGKPLNSPNDVVVKSDGTIWFTDPPYGILSDYEGQRAQQAQAGCYVYRYCPETQNLSVVADDYVKPNGLAFSNDETHLYISDTGRSHQQDGPAHIRRHQVSDDNTLGNGEVFATCQCGFFDGFRVDERGWIWTSAGDGVHALNGDGKLIGKIQIPETVANVCFGGARLNRLFICGTTSLYSMYLNANGVSHW